MSVYVLAPGPTPVPAVPAAELVHNLGGQVVDTAVGLAPVAVPFVLTLAAIAWVLERFGVAGRIELAQLERAEAATAAAREQKRARSAARKQARWDSMLEDAYTERRRRELRHRFTGSY